MAVVSPFARIRFKCHEQAPRSARVPAFFHSADRLHNIKGITLMRPSMVTSLQATICVLALTACGGGGSSGGATGAPPSATPGSAGPTTVVDAGTGSAGPVVPPEEPGTLPWSKGELAYAMATPPKRWFYDLTAAGTARELRNDLSGALAGEVQFVQSHSVAPGGNDARELPRPVALREALVLLLADGGPANADPVNDKMLVTARRNGVVLGTQPMRPPVLLPRSDNSAMDARGDVGYSKRAWSAVLPYEWMRPGMELEFSFVAASGNSSSGKLAANKIEFGAPTELVVQNIRLGMLTPPNANTGYLMQQPERAGTDYFQTLPIARLTVAQYQDVQLDKVIVATGGGAIYTTSNPSPQNGGVYDGDMRENVAKVQVAQGINLANYGLVDSLINESSPETFSQRVVHHARGLYANGVVDHGLSGGNGMITLYNSIGNEFSHEMGHSYGLGHYPGLSADAKNPVHHADSGWGYISWRQRLRGNLKWNSAFDARGTANGESYYSGNFDGAFNYGADAMSGGRTESAFSQYTHHTGYSARRIQTYLSTARSGGARAIPDPTYPTGWRAWDATTGEWVDRSSLSPVFSAPKPSAAGVPVVTILGGYQTVNRALNLVYPGFFGNWGVVYDNLAQPAPGEGACWLEVSLVGASPLRVALTPSKSETEPPRKFHLNVAASRQPREAAIKCRSATGETTLAQQALGDPISPLHAAVSVGMDRGMTALRDVELAQLNDLLATKAAGTALNLDQQEILLQWRDQLSSMSPASQAWAKDWLSVREKTLVLNAHVRTQQSLLGPAASGTVVDALKQQAVALGLFDTQGVLIKPAAAELRLLLNDRSCLAIDDPLSDVPQLLRDPSQACKNIARQQWWMDAAGRVRNAARPDLCLRTDGGWYSAITLAACRLQDRGQAFVQQDSGRLQAVNYGNRSIEAGNPAHIANNEEGSARGWGKLPLDSRAMWTQLEAESLLALWRQFGT